MTVKKSSTKEDAYRQARNKRLMLFLSLIYGIPFLLLLILLLPDAIPTIRYALFSNLSSEEVVLLFFSSLFLVLIFGAIALSIIVRERENKRLGHSKTDDSRSYFEGEIAKLNEMLVSTNERWNDVYHLVLAAQAKERDDSPNVSSHKFLSGFGIDPNNINIQNDLAFVLTPFHPDFNDTYNVIKETCKDANMQAVRSDEEFISNDLVKHIVTCIAKARIVIANIEGRNPNVFYELGIAQALGKPTIIIVNKDDDIPVDVQNQFLVIYGDKQELQKKLHDSLLKIRKYG